MIVEMTDLSQIGRLLLLLTVLVSVGCTEIASGPETTVAEEDPATLPSWAAIKQGLQQNRHSMCSFLLLQVSSKQVELTLDRVAELFEQALDHMAKSSEYATFIKPHIKAEVIEEFDRNGGATVLQISEERRELIAEYRQAMAENLSEPDKAAILEKYFLKACAHKLGTVIAERSLYSSVLKVETIIERKDSNARRRLPPLRQLTSFMRKRQDAAPAAAAAANQEQLALGV